MENISQQIKIHDEAVAKATAARPKAAMQIITDSRAARDKLTAQYEAATNALTNLTDQQAEAEAQSHRTTARNDANAARLPTWPNGSVSMRDHERVFGWQVAAIVLCADPFALALMWAVGSVKRRRVGKK